jgi:hypothetical protein
VNNTVAPQLAQQVYLYETANVLAYQDFTAIPNVGDRPFQGPMGGPPTADQQAQAKVQGGDSDIGRQFDICVFGYSVSGQTSTMNISNIFAGIVIVIFFCCGPLSQQSDHSQSLGLEVTRIDRVAGKEAEYIVRFRITNLGDRPVFCPSGGDLNMG